MVKLKLYSYWVEINYHYSPFKIETLISSLKGFTMFSFYLFYNNDHPYRGLEIIMLFGIVQMYVCHFGHNSHFVLLKLNTNIRTQS
jgi:hypothetical protein